ncbi:hypothetical protein ACIRRA_45025, partial [Nocardia sp. NPDC101769]|uniref:hypothetical protein n=1 Tax=Nocardia sp. NPDC101769 TaxID=3364333 RepID=UPI003829CE41
MAVAVPGTADPELALAFVMRPRATDCHARTIRVANIVAERRGNVNWVTYRCGPAGNQRAA